MVVSHQNVKSSPASVFPPMPPLCYNGSMWFLQPNMTDWYCVQNNIQQQPLGQQENGDISFSIHYLGHRGRIRLRKHSNGSVLGGMLFSSKSLSCLAEIMNTLMLRGQSRRLNCVCTRCIPLCHDLQRTVTDTKWGNKVTQHFFTRLWQK